MSEPFNSLEEAEHLLRQAEQDPTQAAEAALAALRALLQEWSVEPTASTVVGLLEQAAETDPTLEHFRPEATVLDRFEPQPDAAERAKIFVDAARARLANI